MGKVLFSEAKSKMQHKISWYFCSYMRQDKKSKISIQEINISRKASIQRSLWNEMSSAELSFSLTGAHAQIILNYPDNTKT